MNKMENKNYKIGEQDMGSFRHIFLSAAVSMGQG